jgi:outer membrane protein OmpA-like peptidoglycan-associated protein
MCRSPMCRKAWLPALALAAWAAAALAAPAPAAPASAAGDPEPPAAQAKAVAALAHAPAPAPLAPQVTSLALEPAKTIAGLAGGVGGGVASLAGGATDLNAAMTDLHAKVVGQEIHIELSADVLFDFDKATIRPDAATALAKAAVIIRAHSGGRVRVEGHTDGKGTHAYNLGLSQRRAQAVASWLQRRERLKTTSFQVLGLAETRPIAPNAKPDGSDDPQGRQRNRRVEIVVTPPS